MNARSANKPSWAQNPTPYSTGSANDISARRISDVELHRKISAADAKEAHGWSKPDWAAVETSTITKPTPIDMSPVNRPMLKTTSHANSLYADPTLPGASPEELEALRAKLAQAKADVAAANAAATTVDPTADMTPEQKAKYIADQRFIALRHETERKELEAWKANQAERQAFEAQKREQAKIKARQLQKEREQQEAAQRAQQAQAMKLQEEAAAQQLKEQEHNHASNATTTAAAAVALDEVTLLQQQIEAIQRQLQQGGGTGGGGGGPTAGAAAAAAAAAGGGGGGGGAPIAAPVSPTRSASTVSEPVKCSSPGKKHGWSKPGWALPDEAIPQDTAILTDSIQNDKLKKASNTYERKVFAKELAPPLAKGTFVKPSGTAPKKDLAWIVLNLNGTKRGKVVMHLHGNADAIVDKFLELKGLECHRTPDGQFLYCDEITPHLYVYNGGSTKKTLPASANNEQIVYGVVNEGYEVLKQCMDAAPDAVISIRQSHIFPVKRAKA